MMIPFTPFKLCEILFGLLAEVFKVEETAQYQNS